MEEKRPTMSEFKRPHWAHFDADEYREPPITDQDWSVQYFDAELSEFNNDPQDMAPVIAAHRWEIVAKDAEIERLRVLLVDCDSYLSLMLHRRSTVHDDDVRQEVSDLLGRLASTTRPRTGGGR